MNFLYQTFARHIPRFDGRPAPLQPAALAQPEEAAAAAEDTEPDPDVAAGPGDAAYRAFWASHLPLYVLAPFLDRAGLAALAGTDSRLARAGFSPPMKVFVPKTLEELRAYFKDRPPPKPGEFLRLDCNKLLLEKKDLSDMRRALPELRELTSEHHIYKKELAELVQLRSLKLSGRGYQHYYYYRVDPRDSDDGYVGRIFNGIDLDVRPILCRIPEGIVSLHLDGLHTDVGLWGIGRLQNLLQLHLGGAHVSTLHGISECRNLQSLGLDVQKWDHQVDLGELTHLPELRRLTLTSPYINASHLKAISGLTLEYLELQIPTLDAKLPANIRTLRLDGVYVYGADCLPRNLEFLHAINCRFTGGLEGLPENLKSIRWAKSSVHGGLAEMFSGLRELKQLRSMAVDDDRLAEVARDALPGVKVTRMKEREPAPGGCVLA